MKRSWVVLALLLSLGVNVGILAVVGLSRTRAPRPVERLFDRSGPPPIERLADRLELEGETRRRFVDEQRRFFASFVELRRELAETRHELRREVGGPSPDRTRIDELLTSSAELTAELDRLFVEHVLQARDILDGRQERIYLGVVERLRQASDGPRPGERPRRRPPPR